MNADAITGEKVHILMRRRQVQQIELAGELKIAQTSLSRKLLGKRSWTLDEVLATAAYFDVEVTELLPGNDYAPVLDGRGRVAERASRDSNPRPSDLEPTWSPLDDLAFQAYAEKVLS